jgi:AraC-like DNA-binding protein
MHEVRQYRTALPGVEAVSLKSLRQFPRHSHDQFGIGVIDSGGHRSWSGLGWVEAICGDIIMVNPGEMHDGHSLDGKPRSWTMLFFEPRIACHILADGQSNSIPTLRPTVRDRGQAIRFRRLFNAVTDPQPDALRMDQEFVTTLAHAFRHHASHRPLRSLGQPSIHRIVKIIDREPERPLSLQAMADMAGVSRFHLLRVFSQVTGATPHAYILQQRVRLARRLLAAGQELGQASADSGFADQSHMTRAFVRQLGMTPARYRQVVSEPKRAISFKTALSRP